jgi:hypothetical protein
MSLLQNSNAIQTAGGYNINNSLRLRSSASAYLNRTPTTDGSDVTWTFSTWVKRGQLGVQQTILSTITNSGTGNFIGFLSDDTFSAFRLGATYQYRMITTQVFRDPSAWYHILEVYDSTQATASDRVKIYINGVQVTAFTTATYPALNVSAIGMNKTLEHRISRMYSGATYLDGYLTETYMVDGQALTPSDFGETDTTTGVWKPKAYTGTYGTNGFYLNFSDIATTSGSNAGLGKDFSGNGNYWTTNNISVTAGTTYDAMTDSPTNTSATVGNYAVLNPVETNYGTISQGNLNASLAVTGTTGKQARGTFLLPSSGKYYYEVTPSALGVAAQIGIAKFTSATNGGNGTTPAFSAGDIYLYLSNGQKQNGVTISSYGASFTTSDVIGVALDVDNGTIAFYKNNVSQGTAYSSLTLSNYYPAVHAAGATGTFTCNVNFGQRPFAYTPPTGFVALNTFNLPNSTIVKGNTVMDATTYTGTGASLSVTNASAFKPDFVWVKGRSGATDHALYDSVRGTTKDLVSNSTAAETTQAQGLTAFGTGGFTVGTLAKMNTSAATYVGWQWQAGQGTNTTNTDGSITSTVSANTTAGFSVVTYTGTGANATVGHGLGVAPKMIIVKNRDAADAWQVYHAANTANPETDYLVLNTTASTVDAATRWNDTLPTSTVFSIGNGVEVNTNTEKYVAYCWSEIAGFSRFGSYTGNASTDGPFIYTGFRPKFVMIKCSSSATNGVWLIKDTSRNLYNTANANLYADQSLAEDTISTVNIDLLSNGFKLRGTYAGINAAQTYIYMAFAENPFKNSLAR